MVDEFAALRISMDKKNLMKSMIVWKNYFDGTVQDVHLLMALQEQETSVIDGAIRDNFALDWYEEFISENFKMVFG